jgi:DNA-binding NarL/FixJ family response regulator
MFREIVTRLLAEAAAIEVVAEFTSGECSKMCVRSLAPDLILIGCEPADLDEYQAVAFLPGVRTIWLSADARTARVCEASGRQILLTEFSVQDLIDAIRGD